jgi:hypothetical protein
VTIGDTLEEDAFDVKTYECEGISRSSIRDVDMVVVLGVGFRPFGGLEAQ